MTDRIFATAGEWAVANDGVQWTLMRHKGSKWRPVSFVRSERDVLARCMREKGVEAAQARLLLAGLTETYDEWQALQSAIADPVPLV